MNRLTKIFLVLLRLAIGWHFLFEGLEKVQSVYLGPTTTSQPFTSAGYLREATGPVGPLARKQVGDPDEEVLARLALRPLPADNQDKPYLRLPAALAKEWEDYFNHFADHYQLDPGQRELTEEKLKQ